MMPPHSTEEQFNKHYKKYTGKRIHRSSIQHRICNSCLDNKQVVNFKGDNQICNTCMLPDYMKARKERDYQLELDKLKEKNCSDWFNKKLCSIDKGNVNE